MYAIQLTQLTLSHATNACHLTNAFCLLTLLPFAIPQRINTASGSEISVYHSFHDEVDVYRTHWWRCEYVYVYVETDGKRMAFGV